METEAVRDRELEGAPNPCDVVSDRASVQPQSPVPPDQDQGGARPAAETAPPQEPRARGGPFYVYAIGRVEARFPSLGVEKEFAQVSGRTDAAGLTDRQVLHTLLSQRQNRYLARLMCWVFTVEGLETYLLQPRDPADFDLLIDSLRPVPSPLDMDVLIGVRGPIASPDMCNGLMVPLVAVDQLYSFDRESFIKSIPRPDSIEESRFAAVAGELLDRMMQLADNAGATDEHRAVNYLAVRYPAIYGAAAEASGRNASLTAVEIRPSTLSGTRKILEVIYCYTNRNTDVTEKLFLRVDVTEEFPFLVTKLSPYFDR